MSEYSSSAIFFLSTFLASRTEEDLPILSLEQWKLCLGQDPLALTEQFLKEEAVQLASLYSTLDYQLNISELKSLLKARDLPTVGRKSELIRRLIVSDHEGMQELVSGIKLYVCSEKGVSIITDYLGRLDDQNTQTISRQLQIPRKKLHELLYFVAGSAAGGTIGNSTYDFFLKLRNVLLVPSKTPAPIPNPTHEPTRTPTPSLESKAQSQPNQIDRFRTPDRLLGKFRNYADVFKFIASQESTDDDLDPVKLAADSDIVYYHFDEEYKEAGRLAVIRVEYKDDGFPILRGASGNGSFYIFFVGQGTIKFLGDMCGSHVELEYFKGRAAFRAYYHMSADSGTESYYLYNGSEYTCVREARYGDLSDL